MEAIQHGHLMHSIVGIGSGDDEMMDSDYDHAVQQDDDYDIEIDGGEAYSNTGDDEMKFDMGEETMTYDHDDLMLDEGEYQSSTIQEEMIISDTQPLNGPFPNIEMSTTSTTEIDHSHITQPDTLGIPLSADIAETQLSQDATQDIHADTFILSQHVPAITLEVPHKPAVAHQVQEVLENTGEIAENTQLESSGEVEQNTTHSSNENQPGELDAEYKSTEAIQAAGHDENASIEADTNSGAAVLDLEKIHPIIVQFESNTLSLFNSEHYLNLSALDNSQSAYPEVPSVFLLQDVSFYTKGFDELFGVLREMFGATIGDDAEITMEFEGLELFLQEDNLLSKSISLSDLMDLYIRLSKQDGSERPDPLYAILSTQARFTKRYSELLSAAGEGKGLSQVCTYNQSNDLPPTNNLTSSPTDQGQVHATNGEIARNDEDHQPKSPIRVNELSSDENPDGSVQRELPESNESKPPTDVGETEKEVAKSQDATQENDNADHTKDRYGEEEELLPAEREEDEEEKESRIDENSADSTAIQPATATDNAIRENAVEGPIIEDATSTDSLTKEAYTQEAPEPHGGNGSGVGEQEEELEEEATADTEEQVAEEKQEVQVVVEIESAVEETEAAEYLHQPTEVDAGPTDGNTEQEKGSASEHAQEAEEESDGFYAEGEQDVGGQDAPVVVDTVYHPRGQSFNAEELLDYEEEEETSPFSEITGEVDHIEEYAQSTEKQEGNLPVAASSSVPAAPNDDDDSFSSATVVGTGEEAQSPGNSETSPHSNIAQTQSGQAEIDTEQHHIDVYQYNEEEASADFDNTEVQDEEEEAENQGPYTIQETFVYNNETWQGDDSGEYLQEESYYTAVVEQEEYANGQFEDQDPSIILTHEEDLGEGSVPENYDQGEENLEYPHGQGYGDEDYEEYQEGEEEDYEKYQEGEESTEYKASHRSRSPSGKRHREEENDILDVQDIKRTRST